jgi:uncharacterized membrane protein YdjX (TVP38/TMEM64 family)
MNYRRILQGLLFLASLVGLFYLLRLLGLDLDQSWIDREVRGRGVTGELVFLGVGALAMALGLPRQVIAFLGGYAYGALWGTALALLSAVLGCMLSFYYARLLGRALVQGRFPDKVRRLDEFLGRHPFNMALLIRLLPVGHNLSTNLIAGVSSVRALPFIAGSGLGYLPQTLVFALAGSGVNIDPAWRLGSAVLLFLLSALLGVWLYRRFRTGTAYEAEIEAELDKR